MKFKDFKKGMIIREECFGNENDWLIYKVTRIDKKEKFIEGITIETADHDWYKVNDTVTSDKYDFEYCVKMNSYQINNDFNKWLNK